ncbi:MAG TPA: hypothetical protein VK844_03725 [Hyphomicrobiales bacterium]|nr:hypothetical protein [Hyphomicrobiales bacterium]
MPHPGVYDSSELHDLTDAFDAAWLEMLLADGDESMDGPAVRSLLAKAILEAAANGETDPKRLKDHALQGVLGPSRLL